MSQPLGKYVGNALEVYECLKILRREEDELMKPTLELSIELTGMMLVQSKIARTMEDARSRIHKAIVSGEALDRFRKNIELQGGDPKVCDKPETLLTKGLTEVPIFSDASGFVSEIDTFVVGNAICDLGGGRLKVEDSVDHAVGYACTKKIGDRVQKGDELGVAYCRRKNQAERVGEKLRSAYKISKEISRTTKLIRATV